MQMGCRFERNSKTGGVNIKGLSPDVGLGPIVLGVQFCNTVVKTKTGVVQIEMGLAQDNGVGEFVWYSFRQVHGTTMGKRISGPHMMII